MTMYEFVNTVDPTEFYPDWYEAVYEGRAGETLGTYWYWETWKDDTSDKEQILLEIRSNHFSNGLFYREKRILTEKDTSGLSAIGNALIFGVDSTVFSILEEYVDTYTEKQAKKMEEFSSGVYEFTILGNV